MNNKLPQISFVFNRRKTASPTRKASVEMRITYNYKQKYISSGISLYPNQWKDGKIINCPDIIQVSQILDKLLTDVRQIVYDMLQKNDLDINSIPEELIKRNQPKPSFLEFCNQRAEIRKYGKQKDSQERYDRFIKFFRQWGKIRDFEDIKESNIIAYDKYLDSSGMKPYSKWNNYHRFLNSFIMDAIDEGYLHKNPYKWVNIDKKSLADSISKCLTPDEFERIKKSKMSTSKLEKIKDIFIFQTYTCLSYSDLKKFDSNAIQEINGTKVYVEHRCKTDKPFTIPLLKPALDILDKYNGNLPVISNVKYNRYLKDVSKETGINKPITSHWARHTGATLLLNKGVDMKIVSKICGHSSSKITEQVYAKLLDETIIDAVGNLNI